jgi:hypothetical protein
MLPTSHSRLLSGMHLSSRIRNNSGSVAMQKLQHACWTDQQPCHQKGMRMPCKDRPGKVICLGVPSMTESTLRMSGRGSPHKQPRLRPLRGVLMPD